MLSHHKFAWMTTSLLVLVSLALLASTARAQDYTFASAAFPQVYASAVAWGDYDNDGFLDFAIIGSRDSVTAPSIDLKQSVAKIFHNNGDGTFTENTQANLMPVCIGTVAWGDYDNDGYLDLLYGGVDTLNNQVTKLYHNNGNGTFTENTLTSFHSSSYGSIGWGDYNNDGYLDILVCGVDLGPAEETAKVYRNNKNGTFTEVTTAVLQGVNGLAKISFGDYDNDGFADILLCGRTTRDWTNPESVTKLYHNNRGDGTFTEDTLAHFVNIAHGNATFGDFNNDGYLDVFVEGIVGPADGPPGFKPVDTVVVYLNNAGSGLFAAAPVSPGLVHPEQSSMAIGDYDGDGNLDVLINGYGADSQLFKGAGNGTFAARAIPAIPLGFGGVAWGDYNADGYLDILFAGTQVGPPRDSTFLLRNSVAGTSSTVPYSHNTAPSAPSNLKAAPKDSSVVLTWSRPNDSKTPRKGLSYAVRVGRTKGAFDVVSPLAAVNNGKRRVAALGAQNLDTAWTLRNLAPGTYYWSVQAIDNGYMGSAFAAETSFTISQTPVPGATLVTPKTLRFDSVLVFYSQRDSVKLKNVGGSSLTVKATHSGDTAFSFTPDSAVVKAGDSVYFKTTFRPTAVKAYAASLFLANNGGSGKSDTVTITGNGKLMTLSQARKSPVGSQVSFQAVVTRARGSYTYLQDTAAGLVIFQSSGALRDSVARGYIARGDRVIMSGKTSQYNNLLEIASADVNAFTRVSRGDTSIKPVLLTLNQLRTGGEQYESRLVKVIRLQLVGNTDTLFKAAKTYNVKDPTDTSKAVALRMPNAGDSRVDSTAIPKATTGKSWLFTFTGPLGQFNSTDSTKGYQLMAVDSGDVHFDTLVTAIAAPVAESDLPREFRLEQNYPNPFNPSTTIAFALPKQAAVQVKVYTMLGQEVATLVDGTLPAGLHRVTFQAGHLASGLYFYRIQAGDFTSVRKMMLVK